MTFDEWLASVCELIALRTRKDTTDIFSNIEMTDAKLAFRDGLSPEYYSSKFKNK